MQWSDDLSVGVAEIDKQHQEILRRVNDLLDATGQGKGKQELGRVLDFLAGYVVTHFRMEERQMARFAYPAASYHRTEHSNFVRDCGDLKRQFEAQGPTSALVIELQHRVCHWLINHIGKVDRALGAYLAPRS